MHAHVHRHAKQNLHPPIRGSHAWRHPATGAMVMDSTPTINSCESASNWQSAASEFAAEGRRQGRTACSGAPAPGSHIANAKDQHGQQFHETLLSYALWVETR